jgi:hypothetical protein
MRTNSRCQDSRSTALIVALLAAAAALLLPAFVLGSEGAETERRYIVVLEDSVNNPARVAERHEENRDAELSHVYRVGIEGYAAELTPADAKAVENDPSVAYVEPDRRGRVKAQTQPTGIRRVFAPNNAELKINGADDLRVNADIAIIDTGVDEHPDLNVVTTIDCSHEKKGTYSCENNAGYDEDGHGSFVAGVAAALDNGIGVVGVAPGARIHSVKVTQENEEASYWYSDLIAGIEWVTERADQIEVANMSLGCLIEPPKDECSSPSLEEAIAESVDAGVVYVDAAGNESTDASYSVPAKYDDTITVSALADFDGAPPGSTGQEACSRYDVDDTLWTENETQEEEEENRGSNWGHDVDIAAPGVCIDSTSQYDEYATGDGTSFAAPHVTGAVAILAAIDKPESAADVAALKQKLLSSGSFNWTDDSGDGIKEPLLDVHDASIFYIPGKTTGLGVTSHIEGAMDLFSRKPDGRIGQINYNPFTNFPGWTTWDNLTIPYNDSQPIEGSPAVISRNKDSRDVFVTGTNHALYFRNFYSGQGWSSWFWLETPVEAIGSPAATVRPSNGFDVVIRGSDNKIYQKTYSDLNGWSVWKDLGAPAGGATSAPATATRFNQEYVDVMVRGTNNSIWHKTYHNGQWTSWIDLGGASASAPALTATRNTKNLYLFVRRADSKIWYRKLPPYSAWTAWKSLGGPFVGDPAATSRSLETVDVFAVDTDQRVRDRRFVVGGWTNWMRIENNCAPGQCTWKPLAGTSVAASSSLIAASGAEDALSTFASEGEQIDSEPIVSLPGEIDPALRDGEGEYVVDASAVTADELLDLVTVGDDGTVRVYPGLEEGAFDEPITSSFAIAPAMNGAGPNEPVAVADVNADAVDDLIVFVGPGSGKVEVHLGAVDGTFAATGVSSLSGSLDSALLDASGSYLLDAADVTGDGFADLVTVRTTGAAYVYPGQEDGKFAAAVAAASIDPIFDNGTGQEPIGLGDVDGDGLADLLTLNGSAAKLYKGQESGAFATATTAYSSIDSSLQDKTGEDLIGLLDYNRDGRADLISTDADGDLLTYAGQADGTLALPETLAGELPSVRYQPSGQEFAAEKPLLRRPGCKAAGCPWRADAVESDVNGDRSSDLVTLSSDGSAHVYESNGSTYAIGGGASSFSGTLDPALHDGRGHYVVDVADVNGNGKSDLVTLTDSGGVYVHPGMGNGQFQTPGIVAQGSLEPMMNGAGDFEPVAAADVTGDKRADLIGYRGSASSGKVVTFAGQANGSFGSQQTAVASLDDALTDASGEYLLDAVDVNGDRLADLVTVDNQSNLRTYKGQANGTFTAAVKASTGVDPVMDNGSGHEPIGLADVNGDDRADLVTLHTDGSLYVLPGRSDGGFDPPAGGGVALAPSYTGLDSSLLDGTGLDLLGLLDYDGDERADLIALNAAGDVLSYQAKTDLTFASPVTSTGPVPSNRFDARPGHQPATEMPFWRRGGCAASGCDWPLPSGAVPWSVSDMQPPTVPTRRFEDVSCTSAEACIAVGSKSESGAEKPQAQGWNGSSWSVHTSVPIPSGATSGRLASVSCVSTSFCLAVGSYVDSGGVRKTLGMSWNGSAWSVVTSPNPSGATSSELAGVSCSSSTSCLAVGRYTDSGGVQKDLGTQWNGTTWSIGSGSGSLPSGATAGELLDVNCGSKCLAVGNYVDSAGVRRVYVKQIAFTIWSHISGATNPGGATSAELSAVQCLPSAGPCFVAGSYVDANGLRKTLAMSRPDASSTWTTATTPNVADATSSRFVELSCQSASACTAAGFSNGTDGSRALVERFDGTNWTQDSVPVPSKSPYTKLLGVSCPSAGACVAVGSSDYGDGFAPRNLAYKLAEGSWSVTQSDQVVRKAGTVRGVSCVSGSDCVAVGGLDSGSGLVETAWTLGGSGWSQMAPTAEVETPLLKDVACTATNACTAVGVKGPSNQRTTLAERWNGTSWSVQSTPNPENATTTDLGSTSCSSATHCVAVGSYTVSGTKKTLALSWNGSAWSIPTTPNPSGAQASELVGVTCVSSTSCAAAGNYVDSEGTKRSLVVRWDGTSWTTSSTSTPSGATSTELAGVACASSSSCVAVGSYVDAAGIRKPHILRLQFGIWTPETTPVPAGVSVSRLRDIHCDASLACRAVGSKTDSGVERTLAMKRTTSWSIQPTPNPAGSQTLNAVGCKSASSCVGAGFLNNGSSEEPLALTG